VIGLSGLPQRGLPSRIYTVDLLLSLRRNADESARDKLRAACPELVMSRRIRKSVEFQRRQQPHDPKRQHIDVGDIRRVPALLQQKTKPVVACE
jgi:hypothetical protein